MQIIKMNDEFLTPCMLQGVIMKHTEYLVRSNNFSSSAQRRYTDFEVFYDLLVARYPYR